MNLVIGAGVSGLSFAGFLNNDDYLIIDASSEIGGYCKTIKKDGFIWDYSGHFFHFRNEWLERYICEYISSDSILKCKKNTQIKYNNRYVDFPFQKNIHQLEKQEFIDCLYDLFNISKQDFSTFKQMLYSKFGVAISEKFLIPYNEKLYACDLDKLDVNAMGRFFPYANKEDIISNFKNANNSSYNTYFTYPRGGAIEYINSLAARVNKDKIKLNERVFSIDLHKKTVKTEKGELQYSNIISSIPFPELLELCSITFDRSKYSWNKVLVFNLGFNKKGRDIHNHWIYFPEKKFSFYRIGYYDNIFSDERMSLYVELGFGKDDSIDVEYYKAKVIDDLKAAMIIDDHVLVSSHHIIMDPAYVHITQESIADVEHKKAELAKYNIFSIGRYGSWTYCSIEDNMLEAKALADLLSVKQ